MDDVVATANYYRDTLGLRYERLWGDPPAFCMVMRNGIVMMLSQFEREAPLAILFIVAVDSLGVLQTQFPLTLRMGTGVGFAQARLLSALLEKRSTWVIVTALGLTAPFAIADLANVLDRPVPFHLAAYIALGGSVCGSQSLLLRRVGRHAAWWLVASPLGWSPPPSYVSYRSSGRNWLSTM